MKGKKHIDVDKKILKMKILIGVGCFSYILLFSLTLAFSDAYKLLSNINAIGLIWTIFALAFTIYAFLIPKIIKTIRMHKKMEKAFEKSNYLIFFSKIYIHYEIIKFLKKIIEYLIYCMITFIMLFTVDALTINISSTFDIIFIKILSSSSLSVLMLIYTIYAVLFREMVSYSELFSDEEINDLDKSLDTMIGWRNEEIIPTNNNDKQDDNDKKQQG